MKNRIMKKIQSNIGEFEIWILLLIMSIWYFRTIGGSFSVDEIIYIGAAKSIFNGVFFVNLEHPPLGKYLIGLGIQIFGENSLGARSFSAVFGLSTIFVTYRIGRELGGRIPSIMGALLLGITHIFYSYSGHAMLDIYLTFFATITLYFLLLSTSQGKVKKELKLKYGIMIGLFSGLSLMSKLYGIFFVISAFLIIFGFFGDFNVMKRDSKFGFFIKRNKVLLISIGVFLLTILLVYVPYLSDPMRSLDYMFDRNISHLEAGHAQTVAWKTYDYPPFWSYLFWIYEMGAIYIIGLACSFFLIIYKLLKGYLSRKEKVLLLYFLIPFISLSALTVKFPRYIIPLVPMMAVIVVFSLNRVIIGILERTDSMSLKIPLLDRPKIISVFAIGVIFMLIPSPYYHLRDDPEIGVDSGYEKVADKVLEIYEKNTMDEMNVLCFYAQILKYYLEDHLDIINITYLKYYSSMDEELEDLQDGVFDLVVDYRYQSRYSGQEIYRYIRDNSNETIPIDQGLCIFVMKDMKI